MANPKGTFIAIDGGDGSGKTTQVDLLKERLGRDDVVYVSDPGGTDIGLKLREMVQYHEGLSKRAELFLFLASRAQLAEEIIVPALAAGKHVIANRYDLSTIAYQIYGRDRLNDIELIRTVSNYARVVEPDLYVFIDVPVEVGLARLATRGEVLTRFEQEKIDFHTRVHDGYKKEIQNRSHVVVDGTQSIDDVYKDIERTVLTTIGT